MQLEDQYRFQIEAFALIGDNAETELSCNRCDWTAVIDGPITLADLNQRADEHTEVCR